MRLIDADAEIAKIEQEIKKTKSRIKEWEENREDRGGYHNIDEKISQFKNNVLQAQMEIEYLKRYSTAYDVDKVVERLEEHFNAADDKTIRLAYHHALEIVKSGGIE